MPLDLPSTSIKSHIPQRTRDNRWHQSSMQSIRSIAMAITPLFLALFLLLPLVPVASSDHLLGREKLTHLHFFLHDIVDGTDPTVVLVAKPNTTIGAQNIITFGSMYVIDDPLTEGPELTPETIVGRAQGMYASTGLDRLTLVMAVDFTFTAGEHKGGSFSVMSMNPVSDRERELAVVGGRGEFRFGRGYAELRTHSLRKDSAVVEYNVTLLHY